MKSELTSDVYKLIKSGKTKEAFQLLSEAQLSKNDQRLILLVSQFSKLQKDAIMNQLSPDEEQRMHTRINKSILEFLDQLDSEEIENNKKKKQEEASKIKLKSESQSLVPKVKKENSLKKYRAYLLLLLFIPLVYFLLQDRDPIPPQKFSSAPERIEEGNSSVIPTVSDEFLKDAKKIWNTGNTLYHEDFSDRNSPGFNKKIWTLDTRSKDYSMKVADDGYYEIIIKTDKSDNSFARHKYIGGISYNATTELIPYAAKIRIDKTGTCKAETLCMGRGITTRYHNSKKSAYAFTINDQGDLQFNRLSDFRKPKNSKNLFTKRVAIKSGGIYELGLVSIGNDFFLYFNKEFLAKVSDRNALTGKSNGIIACGKGNHLFDEIILEKIEK